MAVPLINLQFAWCWLLMGIVTGAIQGLKFHHENWMGGYHSWPRRLTRLGHIAFIGTALLNFVFYLSAYTAHLVGPIVTVASICFLIGGVAMPVVCYLAAWRKPLRQLFFIPVIALMLAVALTTWATLNLSLTGR